MHLGLVDLNLLRVFDTLLTEGSVSRAGERLHITPSAVSHSLTRLRRLFNDALFVRGPSGMAATPRAMEMAPRIRSALINLEMAIAPSIFDAELSHHTFTIACNEYAAAAILPTLLSRGWAEAKNIKIVTTAISPDVTRALEVGNVDLAIGYFPTLPDQVTSASLLEDRLSWVMRDAPTAASGVERLRSAIRREGEQLAALLSEAALDLDSRRPAQFSNHGMVVRIREEGSLSIEPVPYAAVAGLLNRDASLAVVVPTTLARSLGSNAVSVCGVPDIEPLELRVIWSKARATPRLSWLVRLVDAAAKEVISKEDDLVGAMSVGKAKARQVRRTVIAASDRFDGARP